MDNPADTSASRVGAGAATADGAADDEVSRARRQWRAAAESLFPALIGDPVTYAAAVEVIGDVADRLGRDDAQLTDLAAAMAAADQLVAELDVRVPPALPVALLVGVACGMRERELIAQEVRRMRREAIEGARASGDRWAVLQGPERIEDLTGGFGGGPAGCTHLHLSSGTEVRATVDAYSPEPYRIDVIPADGSTPSSSSFRARAAWLAEFHDRRAALDVR
jgi:hypothetical protein